MVVARRKERRENLSLGQVKRTYSFWGRHPRLYATVCNLVALGHRKEETLRRRTVEQLAALQEGRILEIACGTGRDLPYVKQMVGTRTPLVALDYTPEMLAVAHKNVGENGWDNVYFVRSDAAALPFRDGTFVGVLCVFGMSAIPGYPTCLHEAIRVTRENGRLVICDGRPFRGGWRWLNLLIEPLLGRACSWAYERDIVRDLYTLDPDLAVEEFNAGTLFIAVLTRRAERLGHEKVMPLRTRTGR